MTDDVMCRGALFIREAAIDWNVVPRDSYLRDISALKDFRRLAFESNVTFFAGENGTGKSTLLEGIAVAYGYNPDAGVDVNNYMPVTLDELIANNAHFKEGLTDKVVEIDHIGGAGC